MQCLQLAPPLPVWRDFVLPIGYHYEYHRVLYERLLPNHCALNLFLPYVQISCFIADVGLCHCVFEIISTISLDYLQSRYT